MLPKCMYINNSKTAHRKLMKCLLYFTTFYILLFSFNLLVVMDAWMNACRHVSLCSLCGGLCTHTHSHAVEVSSSGIGVGVGVFLHRLDAFIPPFFWCRLH